MDKNKVIGLIEKGMIYQHKSSYVSSYKVKAKNCFEEAIKELQKPDWISVEDELPPYGEDVWVVSKELPNHIYKCGRTEASIPKDSHDFVILWEGIMAIITHWRKIDKLEE